MPKIQTVDSKTGTPTGELKMGRSVTAKTNANPIDISTMKPATEQGQSAKVEGQIVATPLDPKFEALAKREASFVSKEREFKAQQAAMAETIKAEVDKALGSYRGRIKQNALDVLNEEGITYDQLVEQAIAMQANPKAGETNTRLEAIEAAQKKLVEDAQKSAQSQREAAVKQLTYDATDLIESDPSFETIKATESIDDVVNLITRTFDETGKLMSVEQAAKLVEEELLAEAIKIASLAKVKAKLTPEMVIETKPQTRQEQNTLTNSMNANRKLSSRERAILAFNGKKLT